LNTTPTAEPESISIRYLFKSKEQEMPTKREDGWWIVQFHADDPREIVKLENGEVWTAGADFPFEEGYREIKWIRRVSLED